MSRKGAIFSEKVVQLASIDSVIVELMPEKGGLSLYFLLETLDSIEQI